ncbi:MAG: serine/threonine-protein kinase [Galactobacter sp.]
MRRGELQALSAEEAAGELLVERVPRDEGPEDEARTGVPTAWEHPHLVKVVEVEGRRRGELLAHVPGGSVAALVAARGRLPVGEAVTLLVPIARALAHLHRHGAIHGDVSPDNVLFDAEGAPMLVDPGLARALGEAGSQGGTEGFVAPETVHGSRSDVFGWGALAWFVLTGEAPGEERHRVPLPLLRQDVNSAAARLIEDCLSADPGARPKAADLGPALLECHKATPLDATAAAGGDGVPLLRTRIPEPPRWRRLLRRRTGSGGGTVPDGTDRRRARGTGLGAGLGTDRGSGHGTVRRAVRWVVGVGAVVAVAAAVVTVVWEPQVPTSEGRSAAGTSGGGTPTEGTPTVGQGLNRVLAAVAALPELDQRRTAALLDRDAAALESVYVEGPGLEADRALIAGMRSRGTHFVSLTSRLQNVRPADDAGDGIRILATSVTFGTERSLAETTAPDTTAPDTVPPRRDRDLVFTLVAADEEWRIESVKEQEADEG